MKVLVSGPVETQEGWQTLAQRVNELNAGKHGPFELLIVTPAVSGPGRPEDFHVPVLIATESGVYGQHLTVEIVSSGRTEVKPQSMAVDILVTAELPEHSGVSNAVATNAKINEWALATTPRYHFCGSTRMFFQRAPYRNAGTHVTRLIALCPVGSPEKWIHALNLGAPDTSSTLEPPGTTDNPYIGVEKSKLEEFQAPQQFFFAAAPHEEGGRSIKRGRGKRSNRQRIPPRQDCWFCLASPTCEQHLLAHIGEELYIALPKGGIRKEHVLIVPISHEATFSQFIKEDDVLSEVVEAQSLVEKMFALGGYSVLYTDRSLVLDKAPQIHGYLEALPIPASKISQVEAAFRKEAASLGFEFEELPSGNGHRDNLLKIRDLTGYLFVQLPGGKAYLHRVNKQMIDDPRTRNALLQFGRMIACGLLGCPERINWKSCVASKAQETDWTKSITSHLNKSTE